MSPTAIHMKSIMAKLGGAASIAAAFVIFSIFGMAAPFAAASPAVPIESLLPAPAIADGWVMDGKAETFNRETLYKHIDGEAELYMPYGFEACASALYVKTADSKTAIAVDLYRMGSLLDAYGIYANYRNPDAEAPGIGAEAFVSESQLMFYQDRYFVELSASGAGTPEPRAFIALARAIAGKLPGPAAAPKELDLIKVPGVVPRTEKYLAESVLGYAFFKRGLVAEASIDGKTAKAFVILDESPAAARGTLDAYMAYLGQKGVEPRIVASSSEEKKGDSLTVTARDPLYKGLVLRQSGPYLFGVSNIEETAKGLALVNLLTSRGGAPAGAAQK